MIMISFLRHILLFFVVFLVPMTNAQAKTVQGGKIHVGVMLPLHDDDGDGRRMVE